ncbi:MAG: M1 family metallopeptidase [Bacteroidetes bacterium]|nr:M1 family metallopeptidase [Bacteroidota bacterium]MBU1718675.1 M1 family metallopeptidase [Bacteroidota bacterium]
MKPTANVFQLPDIFKGIFKLSSIIMLCVVLNVATAQDQLFVNKEVAKAYRAGTRSADGKPGKNYWQNTSDYKIKAKFFPETSMLEGQETITYYNNSPDSLKHIVIRLYNDLFKKGNAREAEIDPADLTDGVEISSMKIQGLELVGNDNSSAIMRTGTVMIIRLPEALAPKSEADIILKWKYHFPEKTQIRMGTYDSTSFFVGQWYPQMAVYDDVDGWDTHSYNGLAEFYNDFANFDVEISVPTNFVVWATGNLLNAAELLNEPFLGKYQKAQKSTDVVTIASPTETQSGKLTKQNAWNTWKYKANNVSDFSFALSDHFIWEACSMTADKTTGRQLFLQVAYNENHADYKETMMIAQKSIAYLTETMPGVPYPFPCMSIFDGADGMEYPMMTNVGTMEDRGMTVYAHSHEITHTYFPFLVGTNETKYGWMDECMAVFLPEAIQTEIEPTKDVPHYTTRVYSYYAGKELEPAVITPTYYLNRSVYFILNYGKAEQIIRLLEMHLGKEMFAKCLREFIYRWEYKHPTPYDFFNTFNNVSGQDLTWFWHPWYFQPGTPDLAIESATYSAGKCTVKIKNNGSVPLPVYLQFTTSDGKTEIHTVAADVWKDGKQELVISKEIAQKVTEVKLGNSEIPDAQPKDNVLTIK